MAVPLDQEQLHLDYRWRLCLKEGSPRAKCVFNHDKSDVAYDLHSLPSGKGWPGQVCWEAKAGASQVPGQTGVYSKSLPQKKITTTKQNKKLNKLGSDGAHL